MTSHTLLAVGVILGGLVVTAFSAAKSRESWQERQAVSAASAASAGSIQAGQGPVELRGTAHAAEHSFTSPLTQQECVAYRLVKEEKQRTHNNNDVDFGEEDDHHDNQPEYEWVTVRDEESGAPFYVDDGSGRVLVDGATADLNMEQSYEVDKDDVSQDVGEKVVASVSGLVGGGGDSEEESYEIPDEYVEDLRSATYGARYEEWVVHEGEEVYVYGEAVSPGQTPMGSGVGNEMSATMGAVGGGGLLGTLKGLLSAGAEAVSDPKTRYKPRAIQRLPKAEPQNQEVHSEKMESLSEEVQQTAPENPQENPEAAKDMMDKATEMMQQAGAAAEDQLPSTPSLDSANVVVSWGNRAPTFVVSDGGKKSVLRDYSTGILQSVVLLAVGVVGTVGGAAWLLGLV
jgi:hypothetical protein